MGYADRVELCVEVNFSDGVVRQRRPRQERPDGGVVDDPGVLVAYVPTGAPCTMPALGGYGYVGIEAPEPGYVVSSPWGSTVFVTARALEAAVVERARVEKAAAERRAQQLTLDGQADTFPGHGGRCEIRAGGPCDCRPKRDRNRKPANGKGNGKGRR